MIIVVPRLIQFIGGKQVQAIAFFPLLLLRDRNLATDHRLLRHERIHWRQQVELALVLFYVLYLLFYLYYRIMKYSHREAYHKIPFEREAYRYDHDPQYLKKRKCYQWLFE
jgi:hypothetical protein